MLFLEKHTTFDGLKDVLSCIIVSSKNKNNWKLWSGDNGLIFTFKKIQSGISQSEF